SKGSPWTELGERSPIGQVNALSSAKAGSPSATTGQRLPNCFTIHHTTPGPPKAGRCAFLLHGACVVGRVPPSWLGGRPRPEQAPDGDDTTTHRDPFGRRLLRRGVRRAQP